jgi:hypothetical protein
MSHFQHLPIRLLRSGVLLPAVRFMTGCWLFAAWWGIGLTKAFPGGMVRGLIPASHPRHVLTQFHRIRDDC